MCKNSSRTHPAFRPSSPKQERSTARSTATKKSPRPSLHPSLHPSPRKYLHLSPLPNQERLNASFTATKKSNGLQGPTQYTRSSTTYLSSPSKYERSSTRVDSSRSRKTRKELKVKQKPGAGKFREEATESNGERSEEQSTDSLVISKETWKELEKKPQNEQNKFLKRCFKKWKYKDEEATKMNVERGDQLFYQGASGALYNHHFLCINVSENSIDIVEYNSPSLNSSASSQSTLSSNPLAFGKIQKRTLTFKDLEEKKVKVRKWPEKLKRFQFYEVVSRAKDRAKNERDYHAFDNNCESFVIWCKCGLNTSLQVKQGYRTAWEGVKAGVGGIVEGAKNYGVKAAIPVVAKVGKHSDEIVGVMSGPLSPVGFVIGAGIEAGFACYNIRKYYKRKKQGYLSKRQFAVNTIGTCAKAVGHEAGVVAGIVIGSAFGPLGIIIGGGLGYVVGHFIGCGIEWVAKKAPQIKKDPRIML